MRYQTISKLDNSHIGLKIPELKSRRKFSKLLKSWVMPPKSATLDHNNLVTINQSSYPFIIIKVYQNVDQGKESFRNRFHLTRDKTNYNKSHLKTVKKAFENDRNELLRIRSRGGGGSRPNDLFRGRAEARPNNLFRRRGEARPNNLIESSLIFRNISSSVDNRL